MADPPRNGSYQRMCRELILHEDLKTGEMMDGWDNVLTGEKVRVVDVANDPFNYVISEFLPDPTSYGGLDKDKPPKRPRESSGPMNRVSELFRYFMRREDVENPELTHLPHSGVWSRITPWLPGTLMDGAPGHIYDMRKFSTNKTPDLAPPTVLRRVEARWPLYLTA